MTLYNNALFGMGECDTPWLGCPDEPTGTPITPKKNAWDTITNIFDKIIKPGAEVYVQTRPDGSTVTAPNPGGGYVHSGATAQNNTTKYVLIGVAGLAAAAIVATVILTKKKKKTVAGVKGKKK